MPLRWQVSDRGSAGMKSATDSDQCLTDEIETDHAHTCEIRVNQLEVGLFGPSGQKWIPDAMPCVLRRACSTLARWSQGRA